MQPWNLPEPFNYAIVTPPSLNIYYFLVKKIKNDKYLKTVRVYKI
jgi:hypothetical protein